MVSRRRLLQAGGAALAAALAGCQQEDSTGTTTESTTDRTTTPPDTVEPQQNGDTYLEATEVLASDVEDGATVAVASPELHQLVVDAAAASERVDAPRSLNIGRDADLVLGWFAYVEFRGETYDASSSFEGFAGEASYNYELVDVNQSQVEADRVVEYANLTGAERDIADAMLENGSFDVGHHEQRPAAAETFQGQHYLRTANETYQIRVMVGDYAPHHMLTLDAGEPSTNVAVVTIADRAPSQAVSDVLRKAAADGPARAANADAIREYLDGVDYVVTATAVADVQFVQAVE